jgi:hypothetical protein
MLAGSVPPSVLLEAKSQNADANYREFYISGIANRYRDQLNRGTPIEEAFGDALNRLGVSTGDTSPQQAARDVRMAYEVASSDNAKNDDKGWFTVADQNNLRDLAAQMEKIQNDPAKTSQYDASRSRLGLIGAALSFLMLLPSFFALRWAFGADGQRVNSATPGSPSIGNIAQRAIRTMPFGRSAQPAPPAQNVVVVQQAPPAPQVMQQPIQQPMQPSIAQPVMAGVDPNATGHMQVAPIAGETFLTTFDPTSYRHSDDAYEESFTIQGATGEYLGECGVSIADRLGLASPSKVCALSIWVFDKNDPQFKSVTKVLMTPNAFNDPIIRNQLNRLGEHVLAQNGIFDIQTETMRVEATVSDLAVNPGGYFDTVNLVFNVFRKGGS